MNNNIHTHRFFARFVLEAETPLFVGSGLHSLLKDALVEKDQNGLPIILGTSLAGVLRHAFGSAQIDKIRNKTIESLFGSSDTNKGTASRLKVSAAYMMLNETEVSEGIRPIEKNLLLKYSHLPSRQHVRITEKGVAQKNGLFDNEVVYKGTRFVFELELRGTKDDKENWDKLLELVQNPTFRIGSGTRNGYGSLKVLRYFQKIYDLREAKDLNEYLNLDVSFNSKTPKLETIPEVKNQAEDARYTTFRLDLEPDLYFIFSEGFGDNDVDNKPLEEDVAVYKNNTIEFEKQTVLPASSIKGAINHRVCFHYNKLKEKYIDNKEGKTGTANEAVFQLFGAEGKTKERDEAKAGNVFLNDLYYTDKQIANNKIFNHVAIDRFTGGAMDGALFSEKVTNFLGDTITFFVYVKKEGLGEEILESLRLTLRDICCGLLPLGGMTTKGHGMFTGILNENGTEIFNYNTKLDLCKA